ncbi:MAG: hypothetical protein DI617_00610 [Streptococcus pyogenes]|nr:MAG: hypothetical protein DI617_00610 [Streptococcus pyogenes]
MFILYASYHSGLTGRLLLIIAKFPQNQPARHHAFFELCLGEGIKKFPRRPESVGISLSVIAKTEKGRFSRKR